jgi:hypothetical protein
MKMMAHRQQRRTSLGVALGGRFERGDTADPSTLIISKNDPKTGRAEVRGRAMLAYMDDPSHPQNAYAVFWAPFAVVGEGETR